jgi:hypothetical protein
LLLSKFFLLFDISRHTVGYKSLDQSPKCASNAIHDKTPGGIERRTAH